MIPIPPSPPDPISTLTPRRVEGGGVQTVPAVLADKAGTNPDVVLNLPNPVLETRTGEMRPRDAVQKPPPTQIDRPAVSVSVRGASGADIDVDVRQGLNTAGLPERLLRLLMQLEQLSSKADAPVMWPASDQLKAARPEVALANLRRALANSMLFEVQRLQARLVPSAGPQGAIAPSRTDIPQAQADPMSAPMGPPLDADLGIGLSDASEASDQPLPARTAAAPERPAQTPGLPGAPETPVMEDVSSPVTHPRQVAVEPADDEKPITDKPERVTHEAGTADEPVSGSVWRRPGETLTAESSSIRDTVRLLLHGELRWQGELSPGVFAQLDREDFWEEDPHAPGALVKGVAVKVDLDLPHLGRVQVRGMFVKDSVRISVLPHESAHASLSSELQVLKERLQARGLEFAQVRLMEREDG